MNNDYPIPVAYPKLACSLKIENKKEQAYFYSIGGLHSEGASYKAKEGDQ